MALRKWIANLVLTIGALGLAQISFGYHANQSTNESLARISAQNKQKRKLMNHLAQSIKRHKTMSIDAIRSELESTFRQNTEWLRSAAIDQNRPLSNTENDSLDKTLARIRSLSDKKQILEAEERILQGAMAADNVMFFLTRDYFCGSAADSWLITGISFGVVPLILFVADLFSFPVTFIISAVSGF